MTIVSLVRALITVCSLTLVAAANAQTAPGAAHDRPQTDAARAGPDVPSARLIMAQSNAVPGTPGSAAAASDGRSAESAMPSGVAYPPSPMQTVGTLAGALLAIVLAIGGVTVTFRSMREEMRRGRGRPRRSARSGATVTPQG